MKSINIYYLIVVLTLIVAIKFWHREMPADQPNFMLAPVSSLIEASTSEKALFIHGEGYYFEGLNILINKSCSGFNFLCICILLLGFETSGYPFRKRYSFFLMLLPTLLLSYAVTLVANFSRIQLAVLINMQTDRLGVMLPGWVHPAEGAFVYLFFLMSVYLFIHILFIKLTCAHEKPV